jgi:Kef-type K+ transport system membrane component KefB
MPTSEAQLATLLLWLAILLVVAKIGGDLAIRIGQPAVVGELGVGILLGALPIHIDDPMLEVLAQLGVILLLFEVGLESTTRDLMKVGVSAVLVAIIGVAVPVGLGFAVARWLLPGAGVYTHVFLGATLAATSVGITARVLKDLDASTSPEARIILGAAIVDDVLGLVLLAAISGAATAAAAGESMSIDRTVLILGKAVAFLVIAFAIGSQLARLIFRAASFLRSRDVLLAIGLGVCFFLSWLAHVVGLAPLVGAFAAGVLLEDAHFTRFAERGEPSLERHIQPIASFLVPLFFVVTGLHVKLSALGKPGALGLAAALTVAGVIGKQVCGLGVVTPGVRRSVVGIGMVPRGEVGLIFASAGLSLKLLDQSSFAAVVGMVVVTTLMTPPALKLLLRKPT